CAGCRPLRDAASAWDAPPADDPFAARRRQPAPGPSATVLQYDGREFVRPATLAAAVHRLREDPEATVVAGCTDWGVEVNLRGARASTAIAVDRLPELRELRVDPDAIEIGAALTLTEIERRLAGQVPFLPDP